MATAAERCQVRFWAHHAFSRRPPGRREKACHPRTRRKRAASIAGQTQSGELAALLEVVRLVGEEQCSLEEVASRRLSLQAGERRGPVRVVWWLAWRLSEPPSSWTTPTDQGRPWTRISSRRNPGRAEPAAQPGRRRRRRRNAGGSGELLLLRERGQAPREQQQAGRGLVGAGPRGGSSDHVERDGRAAAAPPPPPRNPQPRALALAGRRAAALVSRPRRVRLGGPRWAGRPHQQHGPPQRQHDQHRRHQLPHDPWRPMHVMRGHRGAAVAAARPRHTPALQQVRGSLRLLGGGARLTGRGPAPSSPVAPCSLPPLATGAASTSCATAACPAPRRKRHR